jgi:hypothetical protein
MTKKPDEQITPEDADNTVPDFNMSEYIATPLDTQVSTKKLLNTVPVKKPNSQIFFRVNPDPHYCLDVYLFEDKEDSNRLYLVKNDVVPLLPEEVKLYKIYLAVNTKFDPFLFPVRQQDETGNWNEWHRSQQQCVEIAKKKWIRMQPNRSIQGYDIIEAAGKLMTPKYPEKTMPELFKIAFKDAHIGTEDHPILKRLRGLI